VVLDSLRQRGSRCFGTPERLAGRIPETSSPLFTRVRRRRVFPEVRMHDTAQPRTDRGPTSMATLRPLGGHPWPQRSASSARAYVLDDRLALGARGSASRARSLGRGRGALEEPARGDRGLALARDSPAGRLRAARLPLAFGLRQLGPHEHRGRLAPRDGGGRGCRWHPGAQANRLRARRSWPPRKNAPGTWRRSPLSRPTSPPWSPTSSATRSRPSD